MRKTKTLLKTLSIVFFALSLLMSFHPSVKSAIRSVFLTNERTVLSATDGLFNPADGIYHIVKIKAANSIIIEIYKTNETRSILVEKIELPRHRDAYFTFNGLATNLAVDDIDGDSKPELLVPSFDPQLIAHLNVYKFNDASQRFESVNPSDLSP